MEIIIQYTSGIKCKLASSFFNQLLHDNVCRYSLHYNVLLGLMIRSKRVNKKIILPSMTKTSFHAKVEVHGSHGLPVMTQTWPAL